MGNCRVPSRLLAAVRMAGKRATGGAAVLGAHLEGPFINRNRRGTHGPRFIRAPSIELMDDFIKSAPGTIKLVTDAPEVDAAADAIRHPQTKAIRVSIGHSEATYAQVREWVVIQVSHHSARICRRLP